MLEEKPWVEIDGSKRDITAGMALHDLLRRDGGEDIWGPDPVVLAVINGRRTHLAEHLWGGERIELIRLSDPEAHSTSLRTLCFVLAAASEELFPSHDLIIDFSYGSGIYCELRRDQALSAEEVQGLEVRMRQLIAKNLPLTPRLYGMRELLRLMRSRGRETSYRTARYLRRDTVTLFRMEGTEHLFYGLQLPATGHVHAFRLLPEPPGFILLPSLAGDPGTLPAFEPQPKLLQSLREYSRWMYWLEIHDVGSLNHYVVEGRAAELIQICEARHERVIVNSAQAVRELPGDGRLVLVAGPSSSGKTSFAKRLAVQLRVLGFHPFALSLDDYFVDRESTPRDADGDFDYESLGAIRIDLFNEHLQKLMAGQPVQLPRYDFHSGNGQLQDKPVILRPGDPLIVEGIHALDPALTPAIAPRHKLHVYVSALCHMNIDNHSYIHTTLTRLFRRIVRDAQFRGYTAAETLRRWPKVRRGEEMYVFPNQQNADIFFNSGLAYELSVLKLWAEPRLAAVDPDDPNYGRARSLVELLTLLLPIDSAQVPPTSLLREFIGASGFRY